MKSGKRGERQFQASLELSKCSFVVAVWWICGYFGRSRHRPFLCRLQFFFRKARNTSYIICQVSAASRQTIYTLLNATRGAAKELV